jgi:hypothetical protein
MTFAEEQQLEAQARQRRIQRESIASRIAASERTVNTLESEVGDKQRLIIQLRKLEAAVAELPKEVAARRGVIVTGGLASATVTCIRTELLNVLAGAISTQSVRRDTLVERHQAEEQRLATMRAGIKEFQEVAA